MLINFQVFSFLNIFFLFSKVGVQEPIRHAKCEICISSMCENI
jgi:hypothetical protein